jgi:methyl-accepting chemotaxis protein
MELGKDINADNVSRFIDHLYKLPVALRDSLMVNRIRKALEFFEVRQNVSHVSAMMTSQSAIDGSRISGSYIILRAFLWAIPLLGFIGTVVGLSHAIGGMSFGNVEDVSKVVGSINNVTSGLGTAFDATLLGLVLAVTLNFPLNSLTKHEDEMLNEIDAFCNEVLLPRLNDAGSTTGENLGTVADSVVRGLASAQKEFLTDLNALSARMLEYANNLDRRTEEHQHLVIQEFVGNMTTMRSEVEQGLSQSMQITSQYLGGLEAGLTGLNTVLTKLGEKQIVVQQVKKKGWFSRD